MIKKSKMILKARSTLAKMNLPSTLMLALWLLVILGLSGISTFEFLGTLIVLGIILFAAVVVTAWSAVRFFKSSDKSSS